MFGNKHIYEADSIETIVNYAKEIAENKEDNWKMAGPFKLNFLFAQCTLVGEFDVAKKLLDHPQFDALIWQYPLSADNPHAPENRLPEAKRMSPFMALAITPHRPELSAAGGPSDSIASEYRELIQKSIQRTVKNAQRINYFVRASNDIDEKKSITRDGFFDHEDVYRATVAAANGRNIIFLQEIKHYATMLGSATRPQVVPADLPLLCPPL